MGVIEGIQYCGLGDFEFHRAMKHLVAVAIFS